MRAQHEVGIAVLDRDVAHRDAREVAALEFRPVAAAVGRDPEAHFRADEQQVAVDRIFLHDVRIAAQALLLAADLLPGLAEVARAVDVGIEVAERVAIERRVRGRAVVAARLDGADPRILRQALHVADDVRPGLAAIARELHVAVVGAHPDHVAVLRRLADRVDRRVHLGRRVVDRDAARFFLLLLERVVRGEVGRDAVPVLALVARAEQELRADVDRALLVRAHFDRRVPVVAQLLLEACGRLDESRQARATVDAAEEAALRFGIDEVGVGRIGPHPEAVAEIQVVPARIRDAARKRRITGPRTVVLQAAVHLVRVLVVDAHVVELRNRQVVAFPPAIAAVVAVPETAVVAAHHVVRVVRIDPHVVPVAVRAAAGTGEALAAVERDDQREVRLEDLVGVLRVDDQAREVERAPHHRLAAVAFRPRPAAVVGTEQRAAHAFDHRVDALRIARRDRDADAAPRLRRQAVVLVRLDCRERTRTVARLEQARARCRFGAFAAGSERPALAAEVPQRHEQVRGVGRIRAHVGAARGCVRPLQRLRPRLAAVARHVQAARRGIAPQAARHAGVDRVRVLRVDHDARDALGIGQADVRPGVATVGGLVDAVADRHGVARPRFARAHPHDLRIGRVDRDRADRLHRLLVEHRLERRAAVGRLPDAAARGADVQQRLAVDVAASDGGDAAAHRGRADVARAESGDRAGIEFRGGCFRGERRCCDGRERERRGEGLHAHGGVSPHLAAGVAGNANFASSTASLTFTDSIVTFCPFGPPLGPDSIENGMYTPATCS